LILNFLKEFNSAIKKLSIYPSEHPAVKTSLQKTYQIFKELLEGKEEITLGRVENKLVLEEESLDSNSLSEKLWDKMESENVKSFSFCPRLNAEELKSFLEFFVKKDEGSFSEYLKRNNITNIKLNRLRYEVVSEDEKVVRSDFVEKVNLKSELSQVIRAHPELLKDILLGKSLEKEKIMKVFGEYGKASQISSSRETGLTSGEGGAGSGVGGIDVKQMIGELKDKLDNLSDDEVLELLTYSLRQTLKEIPRDKNTSYEALEMINKVLEKRDKQKLLPQLKEILTGYGIIDEKYFDLLVDERFQNKERIISQNLEFLEKLEKNKIETDDLEQRVKEIAHSPDERLKKKIIDALVEKLDSAEEKLRQDSTLTLKKLVELSISDEKEEDFVYIKDKLESQPKNVHVCMRFYRGHFEILPLLFSHLAIKGDIEEIKRLMEQIEQQVQSGQMSAEFQRLRDNFVSEVSGKNLDILVQPLFSEFNAQKGRKVEELLKSLDTGEVAQKLLAIFTVDQRNIRIWALRVLSDLGEDSVKAISDFLSLKDEFKRDKDTNALEDEYWYKVRNALFILGNIESQRSFDLLLEFTRDPDPRVRLELLKVLEKKKGEKVNQVLIELIRDKDKEVSKKALNLISISEEREFIPVLKETFADGWLDRRKVLSTLIRIGDRECQDYILKLVTEENFLPPTLSKKEKEELQLLALDFLEKRGDEKSFRILRDFLNKRKKGFLWRLGKDEVTEKTQKMLSLKDKEISLSRL
jgi:hypothetical protein